MFLFVAVEMLARRYDKEFPYGGVMENYPFVALYFHLQRQPLYYIFNLIMPVALISFMTILVFTLPVDSGEKMALSKSSALFFPQLFIILENPMLIFLRRCDNSAQLDCV